MASIPSDRMRDRLRERGLELLVSIEYLPVFGTLTGLAAFGTLCEMVGKCLQHAAAGHYARALVVASTVGRPIVGAIKDPEQHEPAHAALEAFLGVLESRTGPKVVH